MTRTELIVQDLLAVLAQEGNPDEVLRRHGDSRSILFKALAEVIPVAQQRYREAALRVRDAAKQEEEHHRQSELEKGRLGELNRETAKVEAVLTAKRDQLESAEHLLERASALQELGVTPERLRKIHTLLKRVADAQGVGMEEALAAFFELTERLVHVASAQIETRRLQAQLRKTTRDVGEKRKELNGLEESLRESQQELATLADLRRKGLSQEQLVRWQNLLHSSGISLKELGEELKRYGNLHEVLNASTQKIGKLKQKNRRIQKEAEDLESQRDAARSQVMRLHGEALALAVRKENLERAARDLGAYVELTRILLEGDTSVWRKAPANFIAWLLIRAGEWMTEAGRDAEIRVPRGISQRRVIMRSVCLRPSELLAWLLTSLADQIS